MKYAKLLDELIIKLVTNKCGIFISGGFDSSLLFYLCNYINHKHKLGIDLTTFTVPRYDDSIIHAQRIIDWVNFKFDANYKIIKVGNPDNPHDKQVNSGFDEAIKYVKLILLGDTKNPDHLTDLPTAPRRGTSVVYPLYQPFFNINKKSTVELANEIEILPELMTLTHTCTESKLLRCNHCWQCTERAWGFKENNIIDTGRM